MRREFPAKVKVAAFQRAAGHCERCTARLAVGKFAYDHRIADALGGEPTLDNCEVLCAACHDGKTRKRDQPDIARAKRRQAKHVGADAKKRSFRRPPGMRFDWKTRRYIREAGA